MSISHHRLRRFAAVFIGLVFLVSGLLKIMDPVGTMLIVTEYARFFHLAFLIPAAKVLGILLASLEAVPGIFLVTGVLRKLSAVLTYALLGFFTVITLILWIVNPNMDCGCFGEAIHLTHLQSLLKNVVLLLLAVLAFAPFREFGVSPIRKRVAACLAVVSVLVAVLYSNTHLPLIDFTDFHAGAELFASLDDDMDGDWRDYPILSFRDAEGEYQDDLAAQGKVVVFSVYDPAKAPWTRIQQQYQAVEAAGGRPLLLVATYLEEVDRWGIPIDLTVYYADYKTLITLNRSNGGGSYFYDGELVNKWPSHAMPDNMQVILADDPVRLSTHYIVRRRIKVQGFCVFLAALLMLL